jgi:hypothetical protein
VLSPESPNFLRIYPTFTTVWGPPGKFYAVGHDPLALVDNLLHTRVFVGVGNGVPSAGEVSNPIGDFEEGEFDQESVSFVDRARSEGLRVKFDQYAGIHTALTWLHGLTDMLAWGAFKHVIQEPSNWKYYTTAPVGTAWDYKFAFARYHPPTQIEEFTLSRGVFSAFGGGQTAITLPDGKVLEGKLPFEIRNGELRELSHGPKPVLVGGYEKLKPIKLTVAQQPTSATSALTLVFRTAQPTPRAQMYEVGIEAFSTSCQDTTYVRFSQPAAGKLVTVTLRPPASATTPGAWCPGTQYAGVGWVPNPSPPLEGTILGITAVDTP